VLDVVLVVIVLLLTAVTLLYGRGCEALLESDSTRDRSV
jgi:hypothetical protein